MREPSHPLTDDLLKVLEELADLNFDPEPSQYLKLIYQAEQFLILCFQIGPNPTFSNAKAAQIGPLIEQSLFSLNVYISDRISKLEEIEINLGKAVRSGIEFLKDYPISEDSTLLLCKDSEDFQQYVLSAVEDLEDTLRSLSDTFGPSYSDKVERPVNVPKSHWWWEL